MLLAALPLTRFPSMAKLSQLDGLYLLVQDGEGGRGHADVTWSPLFTATGRQD